MCMFVPFLNELLAYGGEANSWLCCTSVWSCCRGVEIHYTHLLTCAMYISVLNHFVAWQQILIHFLYLLPDQYVIWN